MDMRKLFLDLVKYFTEMGYSKDLAEKYAKQEVARYPKKLVI